VEFRHRVVKEVLDGGVSLYRVGRLFGIAPKTIERWVLTYKAQGIDGLVPKVAGPKPGRRRVDPKRDAVVETRQEHPEYGTRRIRDVLRRFEALGVSETEVRRILHEEGLIEERAASAERHSPPRRFERASPNQMWQSDIFTFLLRRHERLYVTAFMDDHSRFVVSHTVAHHQKKELVMEAFEQAVAVFGPPREMLTDNGTQYTSWRGETDFEQLLRRYGIEHIKSRPRHPQTLGKVERFWKTLWDEFLSRTVFSGFVDCQRRLGLFVDHYNFRRPHQALDGATPADRYFGAAVHVRQQVEKAVADNALRLALQQPPKKPFYLVGKLGDRELSIAPGPEGLRVHLGDGEQTISFKETDDDERTANEAKAQTQSAPSAEVDQGARRPRRAGAAAMSYDFGCTQWPETSERRHRGSADIEADVLPVGAAGVERDAESAGPWGRERAGSGWGEQTRGRARSQMQQARTRQAAQRTLAAPDEEVDGQRAREDWDEGEEAQEHGSDERPTGAFNAGEDFRGRALSWDRKLAGAVAESESVDLEGDDGAAEVEVYEVSEDGWADEGQIALGAESDAWRGVDDRRSEAAQSQSHAATQPGQPHGASDVGGGDSEQGWQTWASGRAQAVAAGGDATAPRERAVEATSGHGGSLARGCQRDDEGTHRGEDARQAGIADEEDAAGDGELR
jgi:transposase InsO family protein